MAVVVAGTVAPMGAGEEQRTFRGKVWLGDDGLVAAVTRRGDKTPAGFDAAPTVDVGDAVIYPGLVDLHSHLGYNTLPLWVEPSQAEPYLHHDIWPGERSYGPQVGWTAWTILEFAPECLLAYIQVRALAGGTTAAQGWPGLSRPPANRLIRSVDDDQVGPVKNPVIRSALTLDRSELAGRAADLEAGRVFVYHCAEGLPGSIVTREFDDLELTGCLRRGLVAVHCCALEASHFGRWRRAVRPRPGRTAGTVVWSPFSNLWLYGTTTSVPDVLANRIGVALGTDWGPSGTKNLLGELKVARLWADRQGWPLTDLDLVRMVTCVPGDAVAHAWQTPVGRLEVGGVGDLTVVARRRRDVWANLVATSEADVELVVVDGRARYGTKDLMVAAGEPATTPVRIGAATRRVTLSRPDGQPGVWAWAEVLRRLDAVRQRAARIPPRAQAGRGRGTVAADAAVGDPPGTLPIAAALDMPGGPGATAGPPPRGRTVHIPPVEAVHHSTGWLATIRRRGFHGGVLDGLAGFYRTRR